FYLTLIIVSTTKPTAWRWVENPPYGGSRLVRSPKSGDYYALTSSRLVMTGSVTVGRNAHPTSYDKKISGSLNRLPENLSIVNK
ncbi:MAG: hypothetical protein IKX14_05240, partial [Neisseriaceae bacterium]|nr:hypothetical protein [Neisseriaceae bacterium]